MKLDSVNEDKLCKAIGEAVYAAVYSYLERNMVGTEMANAVYNAMKEKGG